MRDLMLTLLTYEPFKVIDEDEKDYIDAILDNSQLIGDTYQIYEDLFLKFNTYVQSGDWESLDWLKNWRNKYFPNNNENEEHYPILFKKICFYCIANGQVKGEDDSYVDITAKYILEKIGYSNVTTKKLNDWGLSARYRNNLKKTTYSGIRLYRNGLKREYLVNVIKAAYYEASRQVKDGLPQKNKLLKFVDVFAGTGVVAASVDAPNKVVNDADFSTACFLYAISNNLNEVKRRIADLHNNFVSRNMVQEVLKEYPNLVYKQYGVADYNRHKAFLSKKIPNHNQCFTIRIRQNYLLADALLRDLISSLLKIGNFENIQYDTFDDALWFNAIKYGEEPDFLSVETVYDIGVLWYFLNSIENGSIGHQINATNIDSKEYGKYIKKSLGIDYTNSQNRFYEKYTQCIENNISEDAFLVSCKLEPSDIKFTDKSYLKNIKSVDVSSKDFKDIIEGANANEDFLYLDSPYFLTTGYDVSFQDEEHKQMLDLLRKSDCKWLFSMKFLPINTFEAKKYNAKRKKEGKRLIKDYYTYYAGFINDFKESTVENYYVQPSLTELEDVLNNCGLFVIFFDKKYKKNKEIMICNFDIRAVISYSTDGVSVLPFKDFMEYACSDIGQEDDFYDYYELIKNESVLWREQEIINNYASGKSV